MATCFLRLRGLKAAEDLSGKAFVTKENHVPVLADQVDTVAESD